MIRNSDSKCAIFTGSAVRRSKFQSKYTHTNGALSYYKNRVIVIAGDDWLGYDDEYGLVEVFYENGWKYFEDLRHPRST